MIEKIDTTITKEDFQRVEEKVESSRYRILPQFLSIIARWWAVAFAAFHLYTSIFGTKPAWVQRYTHLLFAFVLVFLLFPASNKLKQRKSLPFYDILIIILAVVSFGYPIVDESLQMRWEYVDPLAIWQMVLGVIAVLLVIEGARRSLGPQLPALAVLFLGYMFFGYLIPGQLGHRGFRFMVIIDQLYTHTEGIIGIPVSVSASYIILFILFGSFLSKSGVGEFFMNFGKAVAGGARGGAAKVAVVSSALLGTISGSAAANVVTTGSFTIPMMKKLGYKDYFAGAVEAAASCAGQIMPPIMGAAAFVMAEFTGIPYHEIAAAAAIPAVLYFATVFWVIDFEAIKTGLKSLPKDQIPILKDVLLKQGHLGLPVVLIIFLFIRGYSPMFVGYWVIISTVVLSWFKKETRMYPKDILTAMESGAKTAAPIATATACAGIIIGVVGLTGLGLKFSQLIIYLSMGQLWLALFFTMIAGIILGMGLPTTPAYIMQAALIVPALINFGIPKIAAHLFAVYFAAISAITPPVAIAAFAAAGVAGSNSMKTGWEAMRLGAAAYIVPFMFAYGPALVLIGEPWRIILAFFTALTGCYCLASTLQGYMHTKLFVWQRLLLAAGSLLFIQPNWRTDIIALIILVFIYYLQKKQLKQKTSERATITG
jgi:TRAP transporter 4TM/12TM fusion protein